VAGTEPADLPGGEPELAAPEGLSDAEFRRHPLAVLFNAAAARGRMPTLVDAQNLGYGPEQAAEVDEAATVIADLHMKGEAEAAWRLARKTAIEWIEKLPDPREPLNRDAVEPIVGDDATPWELANLVPKQE
jgi:hypothetical protein